MLLLNLAFFLSVSAIVIAFVKVKSVTRVWLFSVLIPILLAFVIAFFEASFNDSNLNFSNKVAWSIGGSITSIIVTIPTIFFCLKKKLVVGEQYRIPKRIIVAIVICFILGCISEYGIYCRNKALPQNAEITNKDGN